LVVDMTVANEIVAEVEGHTKQVVTEVLEAHRVHFVELEAVESFGLLVVASVAAQVQAVDPG